MIRATPKEATINLFIFDNCCPHGFSKFAAPPTLIINHATTNTHIAAKVIKLGSIYPSDFDRWMPNGRAITHITLGKSSITRAISNNWKRAGIDSVVSVDFFEQIITPMSVPSQKTNMQICRNFQISY